MGQFAGTEKRNPANVTDCHDDGTDGAGPEARAVVRGDRVTVARMRLVNDPLAETTTPRPGTM